MDLKRCTIKYYELPNPGHFGLLYKRVRLPSSDLSGCPTGPDSNHRPPALGRGSYTVGFGISKVALVTFLLRGPRTKLNAMSACPVCQPLVQFIHKLLFYSVFRPCLDIKFVYRITNTRPYPMTRRASWSPNLPALLIIISPNSTRG